MAGHSGTGSQESASQGAPPITESLSSLGEDVARLVEQRVEEVTAQLRAELERMQTEVGEHGREAAAGAGYLGAAAGLGLVAAGALASIPLIALRRVLPPSGIALLVAGSGAFGAGAFARKGFRRLQAALPDSVEDRVDQTRRDIVETVKARVRETAART